MSSNFPEEKPKVESLGLKPIPTNEILPNPMNPRLFFPPASLAVLEESIRKVGILLPLLVYKDKQDRYVILDGERRWRCALAIGLKECPANIIEEPNTITNLLTMFNIHNIREPWQVMPAALKLEVIIRILKTDNERRLSELTGIKPGQVRRLKRLLKFPKKYQDLILKESSSGQGDVTADFFTELHPVFSLLRKKLPELYERYNEDYIIETYLKKMRKGKIKAGREFRILCKIIRAVNKGASESSVKNIVERTLLEPDLTIPEAYELSVKDRYETENIVRTCGNLMTLLASEYFISEDKMAIDALADLKQKIVEILSKISG